MNNSPINPQIVKDAIENIGIKDFGTATIRQIAGLACEIEKKSGEKCIHMEIGSPGLPANEIGVRAEIAALENGVANIYPDIESLPELSAAGSKFVKAFIDVDVPEKCIIATTGSMQGTFATFLTLGQADKNKDTFLFIDPGFAVQKAQQLVIGNKVEAFDVYDYRDEKLRDKVESYLKKGNIAGIVYASPNNPAWICLSDSELKILGDLANKYDTVIIEDLAYLAMDFRSDKGIPYQAPFQPSVAKYTDNFVMMISGSKIFSYAGQRIAVVAMSEKVYDRHYPDLEARYGFPSFGKTFVYQVIYTLTSGTSHSAQYALAAMFNAAVEGKLNFVEDTSEYGHRATKLKEIFLKNGFHIVYDKDLDQDVSDGFFFTIGYKDMLSEELVEKLCYYGITALPLNTTGSDQQGFRACTSKITENMYDMLDNRLSLFNEQYK